jgi:nucleoside-diphosphate-sugar epimerase
MKVLITGSNGFIGRNLTDALYNLTYVKPKLDIYGLHHGQYNDKDVHKLGHIIRIKCDLLNPEITQSLLQEIKPDIVFHLAAISCTQFVTNNLDVLNRNVKMLYNVLNNITGKTKVVLASSVSVYGNLLSQTKCNETMPTKPISFYALSKLYCEQLLKMVAKEKGIPYIILRLVANAGRYSSHGIVHDIISKLKSNNPVLQMIGPSPGTVKPLMYVGHTIKYLIEAGFGSLQGIYNISPDDNISCYEIAKTIMEFLGIHKQIRWDLPPLPGDNLQVNVSNRKALNNFHCRMPLHFSLTSLQSALHDNRYLI